MRGRFAPVFMRRDACLRGESGESGGVRFGICDGEGVW